jgi:small conductance mechanosensitive channel
VERSVPFDLTPAIDKIRELSDAFVASIPNLIVAVLVFAVSLVAGGLLRSVVRRVTTTSRRRHNLGIVLGRLAQAGVVLLGLLIALLVLFPSFRAADLIQLLGIGSVAIGFAFRDVLQNFLAGILILFTEPFRIGDQIVYGSFEGTVEDIQTRATAIRTYDGRRIVIPNAQLFTNPVTVNTAFETRRMEYDFGIGYGDDIATAKRVMLDTVRGLDGVLADPAPDVLVVALAPSSVNIRLRWWVRPPHRAESLDVQDRVLMAVKGALTEHGIDQPFPTHQILFHDQTEETDGDRTRQREGWPAGAQPPPPRDRAGALRSVTERHDGRGRQDGRAGHQEGERG